MHRCVSRTPGQLLDLSYKSSGNTLLRCRTLNDPFDPLSQSSPFRRIWPPYYFLIVATMSDPAGLGVTLLYVTIVMLALSWITVILRLSVRRWLKPDAMGLDDSLMCIGLVCCTPPTTRCTSHFTSSI